MSDYFITVVVMVKNKITNFSIYVNRNFLYNIFVRD
jgi:hypothetical protein